MIFSLNLKRQIKGKNYLNKGEKLGKKIIFFIGLFFVLNRVHSFGAQQIFSVQSYGNAAFHTSNFDSSTYQNPNGWIEARFLFEKLKIRMANTNTTCYVFGVGAMGKKRVPQEHKFVLGIGLENYILPRLFPKVKKILPWFGFCRSFIDVSTICYYRDEPFGDYPKTNLRAGIDVWYETKIPKSEIRYRSYWDLWYDLWLQCAYQSTNYKDKDYNTATLGLVTHAGIFRTQKNTPVVLLFYGFVEVSATGKRYFWENRALTGLGIRFFPIKNNDRFWNRLMCFAEGAFAVCYLKNQPEPLPKWDYEKSSFPISIKGTERPRFDFRFGLSFSFGKWWNYAY